MRGIRSASRPNDALLAVVLIHYFMSCLDNLVLSGLAIWGGIALNSLDAVEYINDTSDSGLPNFVHITTLNTVMAFFYACSHVFALPVAVCIVSCFPDSTRFFFATQRQFANMNEDENPFAQGDEAM